MKSLKLPIFLLTGALVLAGCGLGYGGRVTGGGSFEPSEEWAVTMMTQNVGMSICSPIVAIFGGGPEDLIDCTVGFLEEFGTGDIGAGRINTNFTMTSCTAGFEQEQRHVAKGRFTITLDSEGGGAKPSWTCDVSADRPINELDALGNYTLHNRIAMGTVSSASNLFDGDLNDVSEAALGSDCILFIGGGSPQGKPSILAGIMGEDGMEFAGGGFLDLGNMSFHKLNTTKMCED